MGQYAGYQGQAPAYSPYMPHQGYGYGNHMQQSYGAYPQANSGYNNLGGSGFGNSSYQQHGGHHKYPGYGNQGSPSAALLHHSGRVHKPLLVNC